MIRFWHWLNQNKIKLFCVRGTSSNIGGTETFAITYSDGSSGETVTVDSNGNWVFYYKDKSITDITYFASSNNNILSVDFSDSDITDLSTGAFRYCSNLTSVILTNAVAHIGKWAFTYCTELLEVLINDKQIIQPQIEVKSIEESAFQGCTKLESLEIPSTITIIEGGVFANCNISYLNIPNSITSIGNSAFSRYKGTTLVVPNSVTSFGQAAFMLCENLQSASIPFVGREKYSPGDGKKQYTFGDMFAGFIQQGDNPDKFVSCSYVYYDDSQNRYFESSGYYPVSLTHVTITNQEYLQPYAFGECTTLTSITFDCSLQKIAAYAFRDCTGLTSITIPSTVTEIHTYAFYGCTNLRTIYYSGTATGAPWHASNATVIST